VNILVCTIVVNVVASVVIRIHPWIHIKSPYSYSTKKKIHPLSMINGCLQLVVVYNLLFDIILIFSRCVIYD